MFTNTQIALSIAIVLGTASAALAKAPSKYVEHTFGPAATARAMVPSNAGPSMSITHRATMSARTLIPASAWNYCATSIPASNNPTNM